MKLSSSILVDCLRERFEIVKENLKSEERLFDQVLLIGQQTLFEDRKVYVAKGTDLPKKIFFGGYCAIVSLGAADRCYLAATCDYIELPENSLVAEVLNCIQGAFNKYLTWHKQLNDMLLSGKSIQDMLEASLPIFENPIYFHDRDYRFIAYVEGPDLPGPVDVYGIRENNGRLSPEEVNLLRRTPGFEKTFETTKTIYYTDKGNYNYIYNNIRVNGKFQGRIFVTERVRPIKRGDYALLDELSRLIEITFFNRYFIYAGRYRTLEQQLVRMLDEEPYDMNALREGMEELNWGRYDSYFCFQIQMQKVDTSLNTIVSTCELIESKLKGCYTFPYKNNIAGIVFIGRWEDKRFSELSRVLSILENLGLYAGVSLMFSDIFNFPKYYDQTGKALKYGIRKDKEQRIHFFEDYSFLYMLDCCINQMSPGMLCPPKLQKLIEYDKKNSTSYVSTLRVYLENESRPAKAIKKLFIHRSTFVYRLERIKEIMGVDLEDNTTRLHFLLAFQLFDRYKEVNHRFTNDIPENFLPLE